MTQSVIMHRAYFFPALRCRQGVALEVVPPPLGLGFSSSGSRWWRDARRPVTGLSQPRPRWLGLFVYLACLEWARFRVSSVCFGDGRDARRPATGLSRPRWFGLSVWTGRGLGVFPPPGKMWLASCEARRGSSCGDGFGCLLGLFVWLVYLDYARFRAVAPPGSVAGKMRGDPSRGCPGRDGLDCLFACLFDLFASVEPGLGFSSPGSRFQGGGRAARRRGALPAAMVWVVCLACLFIWLV